MSNCRYTVFMPVRNGAEFVRSAVASVIAQSFGDWRLVVLDNCSTDGTRELVAGFNDPRIQLTVSERPLPIWDSWQRILQYLKDGLCGSGFMTVLGHDDVLYPGFLATVDRLIAADPTASLYQTGFELIDESSHRLRACRPLAVRESAEEFIAMRLWGLRDSYGTGYVFRTTDYVAVGGMPHLPRLLFADDALFARLMRHEHKAADANCQFAYRLHTSSASQVRTVARLYDQFAAIERWLQLLEQEFATFVSSAPGRAAIACLLAREVMTCRQLATIPLVPAPMRGSVARLVLRYWEVAEGVPFEHWLGVNVVQRRLSPALRLASLLGVIIRGRLSSESAEALRS